MRHLTLMRHLLAALLFFAPAAHAQHSDPHAGHTPTPSADSLSAPSGLSVAETAGLLAGAGLGMAKPAELNGYPGPLHAIELADALALTPEQLATALALRADMLARAVPLGEQIVTVERHLDAAFADGAATAADVERMTAHAAGLRGELRAVHLTTHFAMRDALTADQIARYARLRGYGGDAGHDHGDAHPGH